MTLLQESKLLKRTPLHDRHLALRGKMVDFGGWDLPVYYTSILAEHQWTRSSCSFFDVSHLGEIRVSGPASLDFLQRRLTNDLRKCENGRIQYTLLCDERGFVLDDILVYKESENDHYLIVNASNTERDLAELKKYSSGDVSIEKNDQTACIAVQGPRSEKILEKLFGFRLREVPYYAFVEEKCLDESVWISRTGYTGEDGFEIFSLAALAPKIWDVLVRQGKKEGASPAGLGARNTLRLEAGNTLYGHELDEGTTPLEAGLGFVVSFGKGDFVGRAPLLVQKESGVKKHLVGFKMMDGSIPRENYPVWMSGKKIGRVTSGSFAPTVGSGIGMAFVETGSEPAGTRFNVEIHGRMAEAEVVPRPFVALKHRKK